MFFSSLGNVLADVNNIIILLKSGSLEMCAEINSCDYQYAHNRLMCTDYWTVFGPDGYFIKPYPFKTLPFRVTDLGLLHAVILTSTTPPTAPTALSLSTGLLKLFTAAFSWEPLATGPWPSICFLFCSCSFSCPISFWNLKSVRPSASASASALLHLLLSLSSIVMVLTELTITSTDAQSIVTHFPRSPHAFPPHYSGRGVGAINFTHSPPLILSFAYSLSARATPPKNCPLL